MLIFRTPPYIISEITLQDTQIGLKQSRKCCDSPKAFHLERENTIERESVSAEKKANRRFSTTSIK